MKTTYYLSVLAVLLMSGCQSTFGAKLGMTEKQWLRTTLIGDLVYMEDGIKAYRSSGAYYYFKDGILVKVDQGILPPQKIEMEIRAKQDVGIGRTDVYDEIRKLDSLRKDGIITEEEFQKRKTLLLEAQK